MNRLCHIGFPKTGSTTLQSVIASHSDVQAIVKPKLQNWQRDDDMLRCILIGSDDEFDTRYQEFLGYVNDANFFSDEIISFFPHTIRRQRWNSSGEYNLKRTLKRLDALLNQPHFFLVVRDQLSFIRSFYIEESKSNHKLPKFNAYIDDKIARKDEDNSFLGLLRYDLLCSELLRLCGNTRVHIAFHADIKHSFGEFLIEVCHLLHIDPGAIVTPPSREWLNQSDVGAILARQLGINEGAKKRVWRIISRLAGKENLNRVSKLVHDTTIRYSKTQRDQLVEYLVPLANRCTDEGVDG